ncbi:MAG: hypothetical protein WCT53_05500 [Candidatus Gracilibacteria bacterium]|jgi:hypothetical protein
MVLSENPHLAELLRQHDVEILKSVVSASGPCHTNRIGIGDIHPRGTVVGWGWKGNKLMIIVYDESKDGQPDALTLVEEHGEIVPC